MIFSENMAELEIYEKAVGDCIVCGEDATGSLYWVGMSMDKWNIIRQYVAQFFQTDMVQKVLFIPPYDQPLCGPECSLKHYKEENYGDEISV